jgi:4-aminobutyrate aminotransferase-like enzyme
MKRTCSAARRAARVGARSSTRFPPRSPLPDESCANVAIRRSAKKAGRSLDVLKIRPPLVFGAEEADVLIAALDAAFAGMPSRH